MLVQRAYLAIGKADIAGIDCGREHKPVIVFATHFDKLHPYPYLALRGKDGELAGESLRLGTGKYLYINRFPKQGRKGLMLSICLIDHHT